MENQIEIKKIELYEQKRNAQIHLPLLTYFLNDGIIFFLATNNPERDTDAIEYIFLFTAFSQR